MRRIAIQDANILIDLVKTGLFDYCMSLEYQFSSTDIVFEELYPAQQTIVAAYIQSGSYKISKFHWKNLTDVCHPKQHPTYIQSNTTLPPEPTHPD